MFNKLTDDFNVDSNQLLDGFTKALRQIYGKDKRIKYIFATKNIRLDIMSKDMDRFRKTNAFYYNDNTYKYVNLHVITKK